MSVPPLIDQSISVAVLIDLLAVIVCGALLHRFARLSSAHPGFMYLLFHVMFFTARLYAIWAGSPPLFTNWPGAIPVSTREFAWAGLLGDVALFSMTFGLILSSGRDRRKVLVEYFRPTASPAMLSEQVVRIISAVVLPIGTVVLLIVGALPGTEHMTADFGDWATSSWPMIMQFWPVLALLALVYLYGFRWKLIVPLSALIVLMAIQGYNRFRVLLPIIFLLITWQTRTGLRWPRKWMIVSFVCLGFLMPPMKEAGIMIREGKPFSNVTEVVADSFSKSARVASPDQMFMDMFASMIWLVDRYGHYYYGSTIAPLIYLPIPKQLWPDKPSLVQYLYDIRNPLRPMYWAGMTPTYLGEAYANFGLIGIAAVPLFSGYILGIFYFTALRRPYFSVYRFMYVVISCSMIQFFRDGIFSLVVFPVVNMMPLVVIAVLSYIRSIYSLRLVLTRQRPETAH
jgi:oligosaccharide repeat unit polymerase